METWNETRMENWNGTRFEHSSKMEENHVKSRTSHDYPSFHIISTSCPPLFQTSREKPPQGQPGHGGRVDGLHDVVELVSNHMAFVALVGKSKSSKSRVVTWGNAECGGVTSESLRDPWNKIKNSVGILL